VSDGATAQFDDRVDVDPAISSMEALGLLWRSFKLLRGVPGLFASKFALALLGIFPPLLLPWVGKVIVDQVLLQRPFGGTEVRFPPFMTPFLNYVAGMSPIEIMGSIVAIYAVLLLIFGLRAGGTGAGGLTQGQDAATQSELALSAGGSRSGGLVGLVETMINIRLTQTIANRLRTLLFRRLSHLPMTTLDDNRIGDSVYRVMYDTPQVPQICFNLSLTPFFAILGAMISLYLMQYSYGQVAPELVWIAAALVPVAIVVTVPFSSLARRLNQSSRAAGAATTNALEESMENIAAVQSLGGMTLEKERFRVRSVESFKRHRHAFLFTQAMVVAGILCTAGAGIYVATLVTDRVIAGEMTPGDYSVLFGLYLSVGGTALAIGMYWINLQSNVAAVRRVFFFVDYPVEDVRSADLAAPASVKRGIRFTDVSYQYPDRSTGGREVLSDINLKLSIGELVAIVGPTGAGKTTLAYLLPAFLRPSSGQVYFDDQNIVDVPVNAIRDLVTYVFQEHVLLSASIRANLLLANPVAIEDELRAACATAGVLAFIDSLPDGLDTVIGRSGDTLSVGQQQRLCIARGLVRNTPVIVLDEPTAALDPETENALVSALHNAAAEKLVLVIAHRLSTVRRADRIIFIADGRIVETGDHASMMQREDSPYRRFVTLQSSASEA
jgi:ABC-type multidrug transport system fused ATPase/permease subunit